MWFVCTVTCVYLNEKERESEAETGQGLAREKCFERRNLKVIGLAQKRGGNEDRSQRNVVYK
jgi:hypothetical protein